MKKLLTLVFLLIGLVGFTQTNSHQQIYGTVFTQNNCRLTRPYNEINVQVFEWDSVRNITSLPLSPNQYTLGWALNGASGFYNYTIILMTTPTKPLVVKMTPMRGTCVFDTYRPTFAPWSANHTRAAKIVIPFTPLGSTYYAIQNMYLIPYLVEQPRMEPQN